MDENILKILPPPSGVPLPVSKNHNEKLYFGYIPINIVIYVKIPLIKVKEREILYKIVFFILVFGSIVKRGNRPRNELKLFKSKTYRENVKRKKVE